MANIYLSIAGQTDVTASFIEVCEKYEPYPNVVVLAFHAAHSYILLSANIEDVQNIAKQLVQSPIRGKVQNILRRVFDVFNEQLVTTRARDLIAQSRADDGYDGENFRRTKTGSNNTTNSVPESKSSEGDQKLDFLALGKNASVYLNKIKKIFEDTAK